ncbi:tyrosine-type recombinase/integrase [Robbsia sp. Bb-Pol-6]|uniref:Tyrosine-type recombinase/integrase n=1 Tax=Robbsia betulipollinis TaxID=2981849 RepID=A0ABT3ZLM5_9BURK|nr:tyrosine-type recombinase/integrase [Robbsia betulipollinis]MCY0387424.1 tyrosine-type recombinase/integrase [Robbsia betulipollinis]
MVVHAGVPGGRTADQHFGKGWRGISIRHRDCDAGREIVGLTWDPVHIEQRYGRLDQTKNGFGRSVPLSNSALEPVKKLEPITKECDSNTVFGLQSSQVDSLFRKAKKAALIEELHFHGSRHEAVTRLAEKVEVLDLARIVGIRDLKILMVYYNKHASDCKRSPSLRLEKRNRRPWLRMSAPTDHPFLA